MPLYNPDLEFKYERSEIDKATLEYAQTLDWHDKRSAREQVATATLEAARAERDTFRARLASELLGGLVSSTLLTLFVLPARYGIFSQARLNDYRL